MSGYVLQAPPELQYSPQLEQPTGAGGSPHMTPRSKHMAISFFIQSLRFLQARDPILDPAVRIDFLARIVRIRQPTLWLTILTHWEILRSLRCGFIVLVVGFPNEAELAGAATALTDSGLIL